MICSHLQRMICSHWQICHLTPYFQCRASHTRYPYVCSVFGWFAVTYGFVIWHPIYHKYIGWGVYPYGVFRWCVQHSTAASKDFSSDTLLYIYIKNTLKVERTRVRCARIIFPTLQRGAYRVVIWHPNIHLYRKYVGWGVHVYVVFGWFVECCSAAPADLSSHILIDTHNKPIYTYNKYIGCGVYVCGVFGWFAVTYGFVIWHPIYHMIYLRTINT